VGRLSLVTRSDRTSAHAPSRRTATAGVEPRCRTDVIRPGGQEPVRGRSRLAGSAGVTSGRRRRPPLQAARASCRRWPSGEAVPGALSALRVEGREERLAGREPWRGQSGPRRESGVLVLKGQVSRPTTRALAFLDPPRDGFVVSGSGRDCSNGIDVGRSGARVRRRRAVRRASPVTLLSSRGRRVDQARRGELTGPGARPQSWSPSVGSRCRTWR